MKDNWIEVKLNDVCQIIAGQSPPSSTYNYDCKGLPFFQGKADFNDIYPSVRVWCNGSLKIAQPNDILLSVRAPVGPTNICKEVSCIGRGLSAIRCNEYIIFWYVFYYFRSIENKLSSSGTGSTFSAITQSEIRNLSIPLPPLPEQRAIVSKLEQLFSELDSGIENLEKAKAQLKVYRQSVLKWAFEGKLTKEWRKQQKDLPTAETLPAQIKAEREKQAGSIVKKGKSITSINSEELAILPQLANGWKWIKSGELYSFVTSGSRGWAQYYSDSGAIFIRITNLDFDSLELDLEQDKIKYVNPPKGAEGKRTKVEEGDFLFSITGYLGMFAIAPKLDDAYVNQHISLCRPTKGFNKKFFGYWAIAKSGGNYYINKLRKGATKAGLGLDDIQNFPVPFCSLKEQNQIVREIEERLSVCDKLEATISLSLKKAQSLRQSILKKAFQGKLLTKSELEETRKAPDWEPAEILLQKIKKEKG